MELLNVKAYPCNLQGIVNGEPCQLSISPSLFKAIVNDVIYLKFDGKNVIEPMDETSIQSHLLLVLKGDYYTDFKLASPPVLKVG